MTSIAQAELPTTDTDVIVVGAGPTGLMAALVLARRGVPCTIIDPKSGATRESRALAIQSRTMEIYDQLELADTVIAGANPAIQARIRGGPVIPFRTRQEGMTRYPGIQIFEQSRNEEMLASALAKAGRPVRWKHRLVDLADHTEPSGGRVEALVEGPDGLTRIRARWCIGADGARSLVRRLLDLPFEGVTDDATFCVADLRGVADTIDNTVSVRIGREGFALLFPMGPDGHVRLIFLVTGDDVDRDAALAGARADLNLTYTDIDWFSTYRVHHRVAARFRKGSVFLAGDAAHVHSPVGGQGMNTGLQDAHNLGNLLADITCGQVSPDAANRYEAERRPVAQHLISVTDKAFGIIARRGKRTALLRQEFSRIMARAAPYALRTPLGPVVTGWLGQYRIHYRYLPDGDPVPAWADDSTVGRRLPPVGNNEAALRTFTWQLHTYGTPIARPDLPDWIEGPHAFGVDPLERLQVGRLYLIRPDGFVAASIPTHAGTADAEALHHALRTHRVIA